METAGAQRKVGRQSLPLPPSVPSRARRRRNVRRRLAAATQAWAAVEFLAEWPGVGALRDLLPLSGSGLRSDVVIVAATGIHFLGRGIRRGQRSALVGSVVAYVVAALTMTAHHQPIAAVLLSLAALALCARRRNFTAPPNLQSAKHGTLVATVGVSMGVALEHWGAPGAPTVGLTVAAWSASLAGWLFTRPAAPEIELDLTDLEASEQARRIVDEHGSDALAFFALRSDKQHFFHGRSLVAYALIRDVCIVSPDPIGPASERAETWNAFRAFADKRGWPVCIIGAGDGRLDVYREAGMRSVYLGDDAVVHCPTFQLGGRRCKSLRQGVHRVARRGHTVEIYDPSVVPHALRAELSALVRDGRQGEHERGFSMAPGRLFDPGDTGLLLVVRR